MWTCPHCGEKIDDDYDVCWSCGTSKQGVLDPTFLDSVADGPEALAKEAGAGEDLDQTEDLETIAEFPQLTKAYAVRWQLEAAGIQGCLADELTLDMIRHFAKGGIKVQVAAQDAARATEIVERFSRSIEEKRANEDDGEEFCA
jgi:hypothetical protein